MSKQETIIKAWMDLGINTPFGVCNNTGFITSYLENGIEDVLNHHNFTIEDLDIDSDGHGIISWRPKSLKGIENNNGWIVYDGRALDELCLVFTNNGNIYNYSQFKNSFSICEIEKITHYQHIKFPGKPFY